MPVETHALIAIATFATVILVIALDWLDLTVAALIGVVVLMVTGVLAGQVLRAGIETGRDTVALLFGGMVVARVLAPTGIFEYVGGHFLRLTNGSGKRLLLGLVCLIAPVCAFLPNATVVLLLAPVVIRLAAAMRIDFVPLLILLAIVSNAAGLLTLVGDPATFIVGSSIHLTFVDYLRKVSLGGLLSLVGTAALLPWLFADVWRLQRPVAEDAPLPELRRPAFAIASLAVLVLMVTLFVVGEDLLRLGPPAVAIVGATLALLVLYEWKIEPVADVLSDVDWKTLIFILSMFLMVQGLVSSGVLHGLSASLAAWFGANTLAVILVLVMGVGLASSMLANTPVVVAMVLVVKGYFVNLDTVPEEALSPIFDAWPGATIPAFVAMMFGATLGGNATLIGSAANVVAAGIAAKNGRPISFVEFSRYGVPITMVQLCIGAVYTVILYFLLRGS